MAPRLSLSKRRPDEADVMVTTAFLIFPWIHIRRPISALHLFKKFLLISSKKPRLTEAIPPIESSPGHWIHLAASIP